MKNGTRKAETRTCPQCGKAFAPKRKNSRYCCVKCLRKAYYLSHLADFAANSKRWRERHPDAYQAVLERYYASHREEVRERERKYRELHRKEISCLAHFRHLSIVERCESDAAFYAEYRAKIREIMRRWRDRHLVHKRPYSPRLNRRIPDYMCRGENCLDNRSQFIFENATASQKAFARELAIERGKKTGRF